jgi:hypothetical protein
MYGDWMIQSRVALDVNMYRSSYVLPCLIFLLFTRDVMPESMLSSLLLYICLDVFYY